MMANVIQRSRIQALANWLMDVQIQDVILREQLCEGEGYILGDVLVFLINQGMVRGIGDGQIGGKSGRSM